MLFFVCILLVMLPLVLEKFLIRRWRQRIPLRIHVHGTRGKSTLTRVLASLLRETGHVVLSKTTGDRPEWHFPDGSVRQVRRLGPARIQENVRLLRQGVRLNATALVVEGMALNVETIAMSEKMLRATHGVITNVRPDHSETMGQERASVAHALSFMFPPGQTVFTAREEGAEEVFRHASKLGCDCHVVEQGRVGPETPHLASETFALLRQPVELALAVADHLCVRPTGMQYESAQLEPSCDGPLPVSLDVAGVPLTWVDLFSVNDVDSSRQLLNALWESLPASGWFAVILATRQDRPMRTVAFMEWLQNEPRFNLVVPVGWHAWAAWRLSPAQTLFLPNPLCHPAALSQKLSQVRQKAGCETRPMVLVGLGNSHGYGERWRAMISRERAVSYAG